MHEALEEWKNARLRGRAGVRLRFLMAKRRTIRSKAARYIVLKHFGFKCQMCGCDKLKELELDHIIPYCITGNTNIHDLQVLCKRCNKKKGKKLING